MNVYANTFFPGNGSTEAIDTWKEFIGTIGGSSMKETFQIIGQSPSQAAATAIYLSCSSEVEKKGRREGVLFLLLWKLQHRRSQKIRSSNLPVVLVKIKPQRRWVRPGRRSTVQIRTSRLVENLF